MVWDSRNRLSDPVRSFTLLFLVVIARPFGSDYRRGLPSRTLLRLLGRLYGRLSRAGPVGTIAVTLGVGLRSRSPFVTVVSAGEHRSRATVDFRFRKSPNAVSVTEAPTGRFTKPARSVL